MSIAEGCLLDHHPPGGKYPTFNECFNFLHCFLWHLATFLKSVCMIQLHIHGLIQRVGCRHPDMCYSQEGDRESLLWVVWDVTQQMMMRRWGSHMIAGSAVGRLIIHNMSLSQRIVPPRLSTVQCKHLIFYFDAVKVFCWSVWVCRLFGSEMTCKQTVISTIWSTIPLSLSPLPYYVVLALRQVLWWNSFSLYKQFVRAHPAVIFHNLTRLPSYNHCRDLQIQIQ